MKTVIIVAIIVGILALAIGLLVGYILRKNIAEKTIGSAETKARNLVLDAENKAENFEYVGAARAHRAKNTDFFLLVGNGRGNEIGKQQHRERRKHDACPHKDFGHIFNDVVYHFERLSFGVADRKPGIVVAVFVRKHG